MVSSVGSRLIQLSFAERARSALSASSTLAWAAGDEAGTALYYQECGSPILLTDDEVADELLFAGCGRIEMGLHPRLGLVRLVGQFWPLADTEAVPKIEAIRRDHQDCSHCVSRRITRLIGFHVVTAAIRLPGETEYHPITVDEYAMAGPDPIIAAGAVIAAHLNADHADELRAVSAGLLGVPHDAVAGASIGAIDCGGFELETVGGFGGQMVFIPFPHPPADERELQRALRLALDDSGTGWTTCL
ncbi:DUF2470 domain-containing protein [Microlunatus soli]|uniref:DUF2470 domain-containing protein n=1 Tax=Microlunatus soli TaxID=630515 RepID=A0A1H1Z0A3_9ACTN|nr:DUF2470 domain-containing protein [Microlunatus soli]SDT27029.1 Protein of unknown function [Microlunatus soli]